MNPRRGMPFGPVLLAAAGIAAATGATAAQQPQQVAAAAARKVVKIYGAGGLRGLENHQSGILISPEGRIVTALSTVLDSEEIDCVLDDGRRFRARLVGADPRREIAVLAIDGADLAAFAFGTGARVGPGTRVLALSNMFGVAVGDERVSVQRGVVAAVVPLAARRGAAEAPYTGDVYMLDCTTNNPGSPGGAVVDSQGRLLGMLGKELRATESGIWLNYALPVDELARGVADILAGAGGQAPAVAAPAGRAFDTRQLGLVLVPDLLERTPPFVEAVLADSPAAVGGLRADDLVIAVGGRSVASRTAVVRELGGLAAGDPVVITVVRAGKIVECPIGPGPRGARAP